MNVVIDRHNKHNYQVIMCMIKDEEEVTQLKVTMTDNTTTKQTTHTTIRKMN